jgi:HPt (histidine-containing phosphotransfer) domain-containing protein
MKGDREKCLEAGMDGYVSKPIEVGEFFNSIYRLAQNPVDATMEETRTASSPVSNGDDVLDRETLLENVEGDLEFLHQLVTRFLDYSPDVVSRIEQAFSEGNTQMIEEAAHTIKGAVGSFRAGPAFEAARRLENIASEGNLSEAPEAIETLKRELERLKPVLTGLLLEYTPDGARC